MLGEVVYFGKSLAFKEGCRVWRWFPLWLAMVPLVAIIEKVWKPKYKGYLERTNGYRY